MKSSAYVQAAVDLVRWEFLRIWLASGCIGIAIFVLLWSSLFGGIFFDSDIRDWIDNVSLFSYTINWLFDLVVVSFFVTLFAMTATYFSSIFLLLILGFFSPTLVRLVQERYYPEVAISPSQSLIDDCIVLLVITAKYLLVGLVVFVLSMLFFPLAPVFTFLWGLLFFRRLLLVDVTSQIGSQYQNVSRGRQMWGASLLAYCASLVPILNLFAPMYGVLVVSHLMLQNMAQPQTQLQQHQTAEAQSPQTFNTQSDEGSGD